MNTTKKFFIADVLFWVVLFAVMLVCSLTSSRGVGVVASAVFLLAGIFLWIKSYLAAKKDEEAEGSLPTAVFQIFFKSLVVVSLAFALGGYKGADLITLVASILVWVNVIIAAVRKRPWDVVYLIVVLQGIIVWSYHLLP